MDNKQQEREKKQDIKENLVTSIDEKNKGLFQGLVPDYILEGIEEQYRFGLGILGKEEEAEGVLIFDMQDGSNEEGEELIVSKIQWLYVEEKYRKQGVADGLMQEYLKILQKAGQRYVLCDLPLDSTYDLLCAYLQCWGFQFGLTDQYELLVQMRDWQVLDRIPDVPTPHVCSLRRVNGTDFRKYMEIASKGPDADSRWSENYRDYDMDVSCCILDHEKIAGAFLVKKIADEYVEVRHIGLLTDRKSDLLEMLSYAKKEAERVYAPGTYVDITYASEKAGSLIHYIFPDREPLLVRRGVLDFMEEQGEEM